MKGGEHNLNIDVIEGENGNDVYVIGRERYADIDTAVVALILAFKLIGEEIPPAIRRTPVESEN